MKKDILIKIGYVMVLGLIIAGCGISNKELGQSNRNKIDSEYVVLMKDYIQDKYSITIDVAEQILPKDGFNTALKENILVVKDSNGVFANIKARLSSPYEFYDNYVESYTASIIQNKMNITVPKGKAKIYVALRNCDFKNIDVSPSNVLSLTYVSAISEKPSDLCMERLYEVYSELQYQGYSNIYFLVGFTDGASEFDKAVENYMVHGKSEWEDYNGIVYADLTITDDGLSYDDFVKQIKYR